MKRGDKTLYLPWAGWFPHPEYDPPRRSDGFSLEERQEIIRRALEKARNKRLQKKHGKSPLQSMSNVERNTQ